MHSFIVAYASGAECLQDAQQVAARGGKTSKVPPQELVVGGEGGWVHI